MRIKLFIALSFFLVSLTATAQRYAVIDSKFILEKLPDYKEAQKKLDEFSQLWQQELDQKQAAVDKMFKDYEAEQVMLPDNLKKKGKMNFITKKKSCETYKEGVLVLKVTCSEKDKNLSNPYRIGFIMPYKN